MKKAILALLLIFGLTALVSADELPTSAGVVVQANGDRADFKRALVLASNMREILPTARFEVVVYGANVKLLTAFSDEAPLIQKVLGEGIHVIACGRSLESEHVVESDLASGVTVVPFGAVHLVNRQKQGWQYIKG
jgi:hypothetical protein